MQEKKKSQSSYIERPTDWLINHIHRTHHRTANQTHPTNDRTVYPLTNIARTEKKKSTNHIERRTKQTANRRRRTNDRTVYRPAYRLDDRTSYHLADRMTDHRPNGLSISRTDWTTKRPTNQRHRTNGRTALQPRPTNDRTAHHSTTSNE